MIVSVFGNHYDTNKMNNVSKQLQKLGVVEKPSTFPLPEEKIEKLRKFIIHDNHLYIMEYIHKGDQDTIKTLIFLMVNYPRLFFDGIMQKYIVHNWPNRNEQFYQFIFWSIINIRGQFCSSCIIYTLFEHKNWDVIHKVLNEFWHLCKLSDVPSAFITTVRRSIGYPLSNMNVWPSKEINFKYLYLLSQLKNFINVASVEAFYIDMIQYTGTRRNMLALILSISYGKSVSPETLQFDPNADFMQGRNDKFPELMNKSGAKLVINSGTMFTFATLRMKNSVIHYLNHKADKNWYEKNQALRKIFDENPENMDCVYGKINTWL